MIIYKVTNKINNMMYIGKTITLLRQRKANHLKQAKENTDRMYFHNALRKYGKENFIWEIIYEGLSEQYLSKKEKFYIKELNTRWPNGYNLTDGGEGLSGYKHPKETIKLLSNLKKGIKWAEEQKRKLSNSLQGENNPNFGKKHPGLNAGEKNHFYGKHLIPWNKCKKNPEQAKRMSGKNNPNFGKAWGKGIKETYQ
jgi:group I intron endonuclease